MFQLFKKKKNQQQTKLVNMVKGNDIVKHIIAHTYIWLIFYKPRFVYASNRVLFILTNAIYFLNGLVLRPFMKVRVFYLG